jgi:hypothetical protein
LIIRSKKENDSKEKQVFLNRGIKINIKLALAKTHVILAKANKYNCKFQTLQLKQEAIKKMKP